MVVPLRQSMLQNGAIPSTLDDPVVLFVANVASSIANVQGNFKATVWVRALNGLIISCFASKDPSTSASKAIEAMRMHAVSVVGVAAAGGGETKSSSIDENDMHDGREDICDLQFSLGKGYVIYTITIERLLLLTF